MPHLSQEIIECILDMVSNEHGRFSLLPCSLVSRAWLPRTRHHLFSTIVLHLVRFQYNLKGMKLRLAQLIDTDACTFTPFVQRLVLYFKHLPRGWEEPFSAFTRALPKYTSLVAIKIGRWRSSDFYKEIRPHPLLDMLAHISKLSDLVLGRGSLGSAAEFLRILNACPTLTALTIREFYWPNAPSTSLDPPLSTAYPRAGAIQALRLEGCKIADVLDSFLAAGVPLACTIVELQNIHADAVPVIGRFLACLGDNLRFLGIGFEQTYISLGESKVGHPDAVALLFVEHVDLRKNTCLEAFRLYNIAYCYGHHTPAEALPNIPRILRSLSSPSLVHVSLTCEPLQLDEDNYDVAEHSRNVAVGKMDTAIRERLPRLDTLGMLKLPPRRLYDSGISRCTFHNSWHWGKGHDL
ncbi:hypothetical protein GGX14DRAFT_660555 [Mycena pura]|uniref:Uncharacterized protein n=1 Tax=Mycena pura TaxID=153505 RepID=A0AAD6Y5C5_9AGAR|nr:hypothetical protein GGX14DRAFT_660555 [Mycena pura]